METIVIIFSNSQSLRQVMPNNDISDQITQNIESLGLSKFNGDVGVKILGYCFTEDKFQDNKQDSEMILLSDNIQLTLNNGNLKMGTDGDLTVLSNNLKTTERLIILKHSSTNNDNIKKITEFRTTNKTNEVVVGSHESHLNNGNFYPDIFSILCGAGNDKLARIIDLLGINLELESLIHLHKSLSLIPLKNEDFATRLPILKKDEIFKLAFKLREDKSKSSNAQKESLDVLLEWTAKKILELSKTP